MNDRFFVDTNIFLYTFDLTAPEKARRAESLIRSAVETNKAIISYQVVQEFFNVALRRFQPPMTLGEAERYLAITLSPLVAVYPSLSLFGEALRLTGRYSISWYDSLILASALESDCKILYTEDFHHGQKFGNLTVQNPFL